MVGWKYSLAYKVHDALADLKPYLVERVLEYAKLQMAHVSNFFFQIVCF